MTRHIRKCYKQYKKELKHGVIHFDDYGFSGGISYSNVFLAGDLHEINIESGLFIFDHKSGK